MSKLHFRFLFVAIFVSVFLAVALLVRAPVVQAASAGTDFESYSVGNINGQNGWSKTGSYDVAVVDNTGAPYSYPSFGNRSLRISNAVTSGSFGDQTFSFSLADEAGETTAENGGMGGGTRQPYFEAQFDIASAIPGAEQPGLNFTVSPDRGDGARMAWLNFRDTPGGLVLSVYDYIVAQGGWVPPLSDPAATIATVNRSVPHTIRITMALNEGAENDNVCIFVDGVLAHQGTSWEDYFRIDEGNPTRTVDSLLFRASGAAATGTAGNGLLVDNFSLFSGAIPPGFDTGCSAPPAPTATNTPTNTPTNTTVPSNTNTPDPSATATATLDPSITPTATLIGATQPPPAQPTAQPLPLCTLLGVVPITSCAPMPTRTSSAGFWWKMVCISRKAPKLATST